jgi:hypothetical protein
MVSLGGITPPLKPWRWSHHHWEPLREVAPYFWGDLFAIEGVCLKIGIYKMRNAKKHLFIPLHSPIFIKINLFNEKGGWEGDEGCMCSTPHTRFTTYRPTRAMAHAIVGKRKYS